MNAVAHKAQRLWTFHGGLHLPDNKAMSKQVPASEIPVDRLLVVPLQQHIGEMPEILVKPGERVLKGQTLAIGRDYISASVHAPSSGKVLAIDNQPVPHPSGLSAPCLTLETDGRDEWIDNLPVPIEDYRQRQPAKLRERIRWAGIVGLGGATFPSGVKLNPGPGKPIDTLIVNAAECEPYITCDDMLMQQHAEDIVRGIDIILHILGAVQCLVGIEDNKPEAIRAMNEAIIASGFAHIRVVPIPTLYPSGGEKQLIRILTGKEVPRHGIPADIGIVCHNVATVHAVNAAVYLGKPLISRMITVTGEGVKSPQNFTVPHGTLISTLVDRAGGYQGDVDELILGGPMMGFALHSDQLPVTKGTNCILVTRREPGMQDTPAVVCIRCGKCADVCPANLLPQQLYWYARAKDMDRMQDYHLFDCIECGCCAQVCPAHIPLVQYYRFAKTEVWASEEEKRKADIARRRHEFREARLARLKAEKQASLRKKKEALEKKNSASGSSEDPRKAAIEAAMKRVAEKKKQQQNADVQPANTDNLSTAQQRHTAAANKRHETQSE